MSTHTRRNRIVILPRMFSLALLFVLSVTYAFGFRPDTVPDWVRNAATQQLPTYPSETNAVVLLDDTVYTVAPDGSATEHCRRVVKILRPQGRDQGVVAVPFDKDTRILSMHVWGIGADGHPYAMKDNEILEVGYPGQGSLFEDLKARVATAPARDPGGVVAYEYEQRTRPYLTEKTWFFQESIPHLSQSFTLELPSGYTYGTVWAHHDQVQATDLERQHWRWDLKDTPGIDLERVLFHPSEMALAGRMTVHYSGPGLPFSRQGTWQSIGEWYQQLAKNRFAPTAEIAAKAAELTTGKTDFYDKTEAIGEFVQQQIRYFVIEVGVGGYQPHYATDIFRNRYGDCKDKATLLSSMLSSVGIHSALMMVDHRRNVIDANAPSIVGDHMIAAIEIPKGYDSPHLRSVVTVPGGRRYLIFDPTWEKTPFGQIEHGLQGSFGLLLEGADSQIVSLPVMAPELNSVRRNANFHLQPDGSMKGDITERRFGDLAENRRSFFTSADSEKQTEYIDHILGRDFTAFTLAGLKVENVSSLNKDLTTSFSITTDHFGKPIGPLMMVRPRVFGSENLTVDNKPRTIPIDLSETMEEKDDYTIAIPTGYAVDELPDPVKIDLDFASYESASHVEADHIHYTRTYTVREVTLPAGRYADVQKLAGVIAADEQNQVVLKKQ